MKENLKNKIVILTLLGAFVSLFAVSSYAYESADDSVVIDEAPAPIDEGVVEDTSTTPSSDDSSSDDLSSFD